MTVPEAVKIAGHLSEPSKMPGYAYGIPAESCITGHRLMQADGTVCSRCYAHRHWYIREHTLRATRARLRSLKHPQWIEAMIVLIRWAARERSRYFRWHDTGDLQSMRHLRNIVVIAERMPEIRFWLPTQERKLVRTFLKRGGVFPLNLTVRLTSTWIDRLQLSPETGLTVSMVHQSHVPTGDVHICPAHLQFNHCDNCRACWDSTVRAVSYPLH